MWRREKGLGYWLRHSSPEKRCCFYHRILLAIKRRLSKGDLSSLAHVSTVDLVQSETATRPVPLFESVEIQDGLATFLPSAPKAHDFSLGKTSSLGVSSITLTENTTSVAVDLSFKREARIYGEEPLLSSTVVRAGPDLLRSSVKKLDVGWTDSIHVQTGQYWLYKQNLPVHMATMKMLKSPHLRRGRKLSAMFPRVSEGFLREASRLRGVQPGKGEVLAVFSRVPIELVADYRYIRDKHLLIYTLVLDKRVLTTRIHDLAAVQEKTTGKIYLVADPSRYQTAVLN